MSRVVIAGGSGKLGQACIRELLDYGYEVVNVDYAPPREPLCHFLRVDLTDYGQVFEALADIDGTDRAADAVVHWRLSSPSCYSGASILQQCRL